MRHAEAAIGDQTDGRRCEGTGGGEVWGSAGLVLVRREFHRRVAKALVRGIRDRMRDRWGWIRDRDAVDPRPGCSCRADTTVSAGISSTQAADLPDTACF